MDLTGTSIILRTFSSALRAAEPLTTGARVTHMERASRRRYLT